MRNLLPEEEEKENLKNVSLVSLARMLGRMERGNFCERHKTLREPLSIIENARVG